MKTFDEVKKEVTLEKYGYLDVLTKKIADPNSKTLEINSAENVKNIVLDDIENIDMITNMRIGSIINDTIEFVKRYALENLDDYYYRFDKFVNDRILGLSETVPRDMPSAVYGLGMTKEDFEECFKGKDINKPGFGDELRQKANEFYGTSIPMGEEYKMLKSTTPSKLEEIEDENERNKAIMNWFDGSIASGIMANSQVLKNPYYQEAKKNLEGRSI